MKSYVLIDKDCWDRLPVAVGKVIRADMEKFGWTVAGVDGVRIERDDLLHGLIGMLATHRDEINSAMESK